MKRIFLVFFIFISTTMSSSAQVEMSSDINAVKTIDGIVKEVLKLVSICFGQSKQKEPKYPKNI